MNYMSEVAKMLGVELHEDFEIVFPNNLNCHATAYITSNGLYIKNHNLANQDHWQLNALTNILNGNYTIKRIPWKPQYDELYFYVNANGYVTHARWKDVWMDMPEAMQQIYSYKLGNCYRTKEEAEANLDKWKAFYESDEVLEV